MCRDRQGSLKKASGAHESLKNLAQLWGDTGRREASVGFKTELSCGTLHRIKRGYGVEFLFSTVVGTNSS